MAHRVKCPECNSCLAPQWIMPNRYYYCDFCRQYYGGGDKSLRLIPKEEIYALMEKNKKEEDDSKLSNTV